MQTPLACLAISVAKPPNQSQHHDDTKKRSFL